MMGVIEPAVMVQVRQLCGRLARPNWMADPSRWVWHRPDGTPQGFGMVWRNNPGLANLQWLALDLGRPPRHFDAITANPLYVLLMTQGLQVVLDGEPICDRAALDTLQRFHDRLPRDVRTGSALERALPVLKVLAAGRLAHARL